MALLEAIKSDQQERSQHAMEFRQAGGLMRRGVLRRLLRDRCFSRVPTLPAIAKLFICLAFVQVCHACHTPSARLCAM